MTKTTTSWAAEITFQEKTQGSFYAKFTLEITELSKVSSIVLSFILINLSNLLLTPPYFVVDLKFKITIKIPYKKNKSVS